MPFIINIPGMVSEFRENKVNLSNVGKSENGY